MPIANACAACGSRDGAYTVDEFNCHNCGRLTRSDGTLVSLEEQYGPDVAAHINATTSGPTEPDVFMALTESEAANGQNEQAGQ